MIIYSACSSRSLPSVYTCSILTKDTNSTLTNPKKLLSEAQNTNKMHYSKIKQARSTNTHTYLKYSFARDVVAIDAAAAAVDGRPTA